MRTSRACLRRSSCRSTGATKTPTTMTTTMKTMTTTEQTHSRLGPVHSDCAQDPHTRIVPKKCASGCGGMCGIRGLSCITSAKFLVFPPSSSLGPDQQYYIDSCKFPLAASSFELTLPCADILNRIPLIVKPKQIIISSLSFLIQAREVCVIPMLNTCGTSVM